MNKIATRTDNCITIPPRTSASNNYTNISTVTTAVIDT